MKKPSSKIREEIARLQEALKLAETREAERIGRIALKAGFGVFEIEEAALQTAFEELAKRFRADKRTATGKHSGGGRSHGASTTTVASGAVASSNRET
jgi:hypothetical protein